MNTYRSPWLSIRVPLAAGGGFVEGTGVGAYTQRYLDGPGHRQSRELAACLASGPEAGKSPLPYLASHHHDVPAVDGTPCPSSSVGRSQPAAGAGTEAVVDETKTQIYRTHESLLESKIAMTMTRFFSAPTAPGAAGPSGARQAYLMLRTVFTVAPVVFGLDKFFDLLADWEQYLAPWINDLVPGSAHQAMLAVGVVEIIAGVLVAVRPSIGAYVVAAWLLGIIVNLLSIGDYYDIALRDFGLLVAALALGRLAASARPSGLDAPAAEAGHSNEV